MRTMRSLGRGTALLAVIFGVAYAAAPRLKAGEKAVYAVIDIDAVGPDALQAIKLRVAPQWSIEADRSLLVLSTPSDLTRAGRPFHALSVEPEPEKLFAVRMIHASDLPALEADVLVRGGRQAIVQARTGYLPSRIEHPSIEPFAPNAVLARQVANERAFAPVTFSDDIVHAVDTIDAARWMRDLESLTRFNRYTHGRQILDARDFLAQSFREIGGLDVSTQQFTLRSTTAFNVVAKWTGLSRPDEWYIVGAHYDAISENSSNTAPGAEDNGSGAAALLELARAVVSARPAASVIFVAFSGEEQGLHGGYAHARKVVADGDKDKVKAVINMDMIGYTGDSDLDCLLESDQRGSALFPTLSAAASRFTRLRIATSLNPWGSDHVPYIEEGIPSLLTIENDWDDYPSYHRSTDTVDKVTLAMGEEVMKMNLAALLQLAGGK